MRRRGVAGIELELELFGGASELASVLRFPGVVAARCPSTPERSVFNSVLAVDAGALTAAVEPLAAAYREAGVRAWTVWVPDHDRQSAALLAARGHVLDASPRSMGLELSGLRPPTRSLPPGAELVAGDLPAIARINDLAYGIEGAGWSAAIERTPNLATHSAMATIGGEPAAGAIVLEGDDDACVTAIATLPEHQGQGLAAALIASLLSESRARGIRTGTLQASRAGAPVYERLGFADLGFIELWELRSAPWMTDSE